MSNILDSAAMIAADMRNLADDIAAGRATVGQSVWRSYADRVEEVGTGNIAKMREALELFAHMNDDGLYDKSPVVRSIVNKARAALAAPPRNCDVGTAVEQENRFIRFCAGKPSCKNCPLRNANSKCEFTWMQMPYTEGNAK